MSSVTRPLSAEHLEPWNGNIVQVTMLDGSLPNGGLIEIALTTAVSRASRN
jgi:hypothetical protein